jgi:hypothetical protein
VHVVRSKHHHNRQRSASQIRYISHREEGLPGGERRELYAIGPRYRELRQEAQDFKGFERAVQQEFLKEAGARRRPNFHMHVFTVDDRAATVLVGVSRELAEQRLRTALARTLRASAKGRQLQGVFAVHWHGGAGRASHPHIHALYSPTIQTGPGTYLGRADLIKLRHAWNREVDSIVRGLERGRTPGRERQAERGTRLTPTILRAAGHARSGLALVHSPVQAGGRLAARAIVRSVLKRLSEPPRPVPRHQRHDAAAEARPTLSNERLAIAARGDQGKDQAALTPAAPRGSTHDLARGLSQNDPTVPGAVNQTGRTVSALPLPRVVGNAPRRITKVLTALARRAGREI